MQTQTKIFIGVYRAEELASRWLFEVDVTSLLISAKHNHERKLGPKARCKPQSHTETSEHFQNRVMSEAPSLDQVHC